MNQSCFTQEEWLQTTNKSFAYFEPDSTRRLVRRTFVGQSDALGPAGTIKSTVNDMSHWMIAQLNMGFYKGKQVVSQAAIQQTLIPNNIADKEMKWNELSNALYCLGRTIQTYKGYKLATHTGSIDGFYSNLTLIPSEELGIFMVHNSIPAGSLRSVMALPVIDRLLDLKLTPWSERYYDDYQKAKIVEQKQKDSIKATQVKNTAPSHNLEQYAGKYKSAMYGDADIQLENGKLVIDFRGARSILNHFHFDQFISNDEGTDKPEFRLNFLTNTAGKIDRFVMRPFGDSITEFVKIDQ